MRSKSMGLWRRRGWRGCGGEGGGGTVEVGVCLEVMKREGGNCFLLYICNLFSMSLPTHLSTSSQFRLTCQLIYHHQVLI